MPLAAPLILPFAELAGITIAGLGMAAASKKVSDFISANPETSMEILNMIVPGSKGLETLFKKKASVTLEDVEGMTDEEAADLSKEDKAEIMKEVGKSKGGDKRQRMIEISEKLGLSGEGKEKQTIIDEVEERYDEGGVEDAPKPKFDYKKFFRKADGGRVPYQSGGIIGEVQNLINAGLRKGSNIGNFILGAASGVPGLGLVLGGLQNVFNNPNMGQLQSRDATNLFLQESGDTVDSLGRLTSGIMQGYNANFNLAPRAQARLNQIKGLPALQPYDVNRIAQREEKIRALEEFLRQQEAAQIAAGANTFAGRDASLNQGEGGSYSGMGDQGATGANFSGDFATDSASYDLKDGGLITLFVETK
jgi:hypothetical protein